MHQSPSEREVIRFFKDNGDKTHRLFYNLDEGSLVFDLGGYEGQWSSDIFAMYGCTIHVFEPVPQYADIIARRFSQNTKVHLHRFGLSNETRSSLISLEGDKSSIFRIGTLEIRLIKASSFLDENLIRKIDLMKINIEGAEYDLLEHLVSSGWIEKIGNLQVQFHDFAPNAHERMKTIQRNLSRTHFLTYEYPFVWENWKIKGDSKMGDLGRDSA